MTCKKTLQKVMRDNGFSIVDSFVSEIPPCERSKSFIQPSCAEIPLSNPSELKEETKPALPPMVTLTGALNCLPKK